MSEESTDTPTGGGEPKSDDFKPITSQEELERVLGRRLERERAKFADYDDLKSKAARLDEIEESQKSELEKLQERAATAEQRAAEFERQALKAQIAAETGVPVEVLHGDSEESIRAAAQKVIEWREAGKKAPPKPKGLKSGAAGSETPAGKERAAAALRQLRGGA